MKSLTDECRACRVRIGKKKNMNIRTLKRMKCNLVAVTSLGGFSTL